MLTIAGAPSDAPAGSAHGELLAQHRGTVMSVGESRAGELAAGDLTLTSGEFVDEYQFTGSAQQVVDVQLVSTEFDPYLILRGERLSEENDDAGDGSLNSRIRTRLPVDGVYRIGVTSYRPGEMGRYTLSVTDPASGQPIARAGSGGAPSTAPAAEVARPLSNDGSASGALEASDGQLRSGEYRDVFVLDLERGDRVSLELTSSEFDTYLMVRGPGGLSRDNDDRGDGSTNSEVVFTAVESGSTRVLVTSYRPGETGTYQLVVRPQSGGPALVADTLRSGVTVRGRLDESQRSTDGQRFEQSFQFDGRAGQRATIQLTTTQFEGIVTLRGPDGTVETARDRERRRAPVELRSTLTANGPYTVSVSSQQTGATGDFALSLQLGDVEEAVQPSVPEVADGSTLTFDVPSRGRLRRNDEQLGSGEFYDRYTFTGSAGDGVTIAMESSDVDTYLILRGPGDFALDNDDGGGGTNSMLEATLPQNGTYTVLATTYAPGETGSYLLQITEGTTLQRNTRGQVYAILAGISDYPGQHNDLPYCAEDADKLHESLAETGLLADQSIVLTDSQVTRANLEQAFASVAEAAGPDDVFVFFYSGHGDNTPNNREIDGTDETLVLYDDSVTDDEVSDWFDQVDARVGMIALDSCFSGGFARDVISRPGIMGIFSSEEDVTSNVASRFQAGGYLSYFLRAAFEGAADADPSDGITTAGELTQYLRRQWAAHNMVNEATITTDDRSAYQNLVIDRGSVKVEDVLVY